MLLERNGKFTMWKSKSSRLSYSLVESLQDHPVYCVFSTSGDVQYIGGCSVHRGDTMSTSGGYHEYIGGIS